MEVFIIAVIIGLLPAIIGRSKGKSFVTWWIYGAALFIIALPHSLLMKSDTKALETRAVEGGMKKCDQCAELIKAEAKICRYCQQPVSQARVELPENQMTDVKNVPVGGWVKQ